MMNGFYKYQERNWIKDIKNTTIIILLDLILLSCTHSGLQLPKPTPSATNSAQVSIIRERLLPGFGLSLSVTLDNEVFCNLRTGEYVFFNLKPGLHTLGLSGSTITVPFLPERKYYFLIKTYADKFGFEIERIDDEIGNYLVTVSKVVD